MESTLLAKIEASLDSLHDQVEQGFKVVGSRLTEVERELKGSDFGGDGLSKKVRLLEDRIQTIEKDRAIEDAQKRLMLWLATPVISIAMSVLTYLIITYLK